MHSARWSWPENSPPEPACEGWHWKGLENKKGKSIPETEGPACVGLDVGVDVLIIGEGQRGEQRAKSE